MTQLLNIISCGIKSFRFKVSICNQAGGDLLCAIPVSYIMLYHVISINPSTGRLLVHCNHFPFHNFSDADDLIIYDNYCDEPHSLRVSLLRVSLLRVSPTH